MSAAEKPAGTPMLRQYREIKRRHPGHVLFYRMGDFYEMFYEDARIAHETLGIALTSRGQQGGEDVPLAGFPYHNLEAQLSKMVRAGHRVAICEQVEDPKKAKGLVKRDVIEVVTAGTNFTDAIVQNSANNWLAALGETEHGLALAWADVTTGEFKAGEYDERGLALLVHSLEPAEILLPRGAKKRLAPLCGRAVVTQMEDWFFDPEAARRDLCEHFGVVSLKGYGLEDAPGATGCAGALLAYARENLRSSLEHFGGLSRHDLSKNLLLDPSTRRNLELVRPLGEDGGPTLLGVLDRAVTPMGRREIRRLLWEVPGERVEIVARQDALAELLGTELEEELQRRLSGVGDLERNVARLAAGKANARDLRALAEGLAVLPGLKDLLADCAAPRLRELVAALDPLPGTLVAIDQTLVAQPPLSLAQGGLIREGVDPGLDELRELLATGRGWIRDFEARERAATGIGSLKIKFNKVFGYHIEVGRSHVERVPERYVRRQTLVGAERYITEELKEHEDKVLHAEERVGELEQELFRALVETVRPRFRELQRDARALAALDALAALAVVARRGGWCRPTLVENGELHLRAARHPVIENALPAGERFVPNDATLSREREQVLLLTGPNMAGKSTYLRMVGLVALLAHMGSWVPAEQATVPLLDRIFTRVGASDNLARGESTFLVEMNEAAFILNNASDRSLVLLDEIGRGTSTFDGLSLAWAITEFLHDAPGRRALTLFATHYHELVDLEHSLVRLRNANIEVKQYGDRVVFTRRVLAGGCSHSYGIDVAKMAGLPAPVIVRAREVLAQLESHEYGPDRTPSLQKRPRPGKPEPVAQLTLFSSPDQDLRRRLREADVENLTPLQAMELLIELRRKLD